MMLIESNIGVMSNEAYNQLEISSELREKLLGAEEQLESGVKPVPLEAAELKWKVCVNAIHAC